MRHHYLDRYSSLSSPVHSASVRLKIVLLFLALLWFSIMPINNLIFAIAIAALLALSILSKVPMIFMLKRVLVILPFLIFIVVLVPIIGAGTWESAILTLARSSLSILTLVLFVSTTRFPLLLSELRRLKVPFMVIEVLAFLYRYFFVLIDEMEHMHLAVKARSAGSGRRSLLRAFSGLLGMLFIRSYERSERIYMAMQLRGYNRDRL